MKSGSSTILAASRCQSSLSARDSGERALRRGETVKLVTDVFQYLRVSAESGNWRIPIHDTLYQTEDESDVCLLTSASGAIHCVQGPAAINAFFYPEKERSSALSLYAMQAGNGKFAYYGNSETARKAWGMHTKGYKKVVRLSLRCRSARSFRIVWTRREGYQRSVITSPFAESVRRDNRIKTTFAALCSPHTTHLQKTSFSPFLPYTGRSNVRLLHAKTFGGADWDAPETPPMQVEKDVSELIATMIKDSDVLDAFSYDLEAESPSQWRLLSINWVETVQPRNSALSTSPSEASSRMQSLRRKYAAVLSPSPSAKPPYIDLLEVQRRNVERYIRCMTSTPRSAESADPDPSLKLIADRLTSITTKLDSLLTATNSLRCYRQDTQRVTLSTYRTDALGKVIETVYKRISQEADLHRFFQGKDKLELDMIKLSLMQAFQLSTAKDFRRRVREVHANLNISSAQFARFIRIFREAMQTEGISPSDTDFVCQHLSSFSTEVIEDET